MEPDARWYYPRMRYPIYICIAIMLVVLIALSFSGLIPVTSPIFYILCAVLLAFVLSYLPYLNYRIAIEGNVLREHRLFGSEYTVNINDIKGIRYAYARFRSLTPRPSYGLEGDFAQSGNFPRYDVDFKLLDAIVAMNPMVAVDPGAVFYLAKESRGKLNMSLAAEVQKPKDYVMMAVTLLIGVAILGYVIWQVALTFGVINR
jgi:hypothetical protein